MRTLAAALLLMALGFAPVQLTAATEGRAVKGPVPGRFDWSNAPGLVDFELQDQFDRTYTQSSFPRGLVLLASDGKGRRYSGDWEAALRRSFKEADLWTVFPFVELLDLGATPFFRKRRAAKSLPREPNDLVLLDWKGLFSDEYNLARGETNILVFVGRSLVYRGHGRKVDANTVAAAIHAVRQLVPAVVE